MLERPFVQLDDIARECFKHTVSLFWGEPDGTSKLRSGTGFLVELNRPFLCTARHVIQTFLEAQREDKSLELIVGKGSIDQVNNRMMEGNDAHDLIAIDLSGIEINSFQLNHIQFFKPTRWPPKCIFHGAQVFFIGFVANGYREILHKQRAILLTLLLLGHKWTVFQIQISHAS
ncbi:MAG TPA: hypothetical protein PKK23_08645 [Nitrospirales bacterium]|nr:hypothetical protein [Nitrospirales bacterium]